MSAQMKSTLLHLAALANAAGMLAIATLALAAVLATGLAAAGVLPWLTLEAGYGAQTYENAGQILQIGVTVLLLLLSVFLPSTYRVLRLETSHRRFEMNMHDVAQAYAVAHSADRAGSFTLSSEYDAVRERIVHLRNHPDLQTLEPQIFEIAAQMSEVSRDLANTYSDENVARAKSFLAARQSEIDTFNDRIDHAKQVTAELTQWKNAVELEETVASSQLDRLRDTLIDVLPELAMPQPATKQGHIYPMPRYAAE